MDPSAQKKVRKARKVTYQKSLVKVFFNKKVTYQKSLIEVFCVV